jgi:UDP-GlcNAc3NAcA epimerase
MKILTVVGARPQFVKAAAVSRALRALPNVREILVHTGQHYDANLSDIFFDELDIPAPDFQLGIGSAARRTQIERMQESLLPILRDVQPDWVLVYGDTNSTLAGALAARERGVPLAHVEAGLRSFNPRMPEESNRIATDHAADLLFAPTETAVANLQREGIAGERIHLVGDVMYDAARFYGRRADDRIVAKLGLTLGGYILATVHRAENTDDPTRLRTLFEGLQAVAKQVPIVVPLHPRTRAALDRECLTTLTAGLHVIEPLGYLDMISLEKHARLIATDSGGVQKEAFFHGVRCVTLREETEWVELVQLGWNELLPPRNVESIRDGLLAALDRPLPAFAPADLYGGGQAAANIARLLSSKLPHPRGFTLCGA